MAVPATNLLDPGVARVGPANPSPEGGRGRCGERITTQRVKR